MKKPLTKIEKDRIVVLFISFLLVIVFWGAFEQAGGLMNLYAKEKTNRMLMGWEVPASWFQSLNAMFIIFLGTAVAAYWARRKLKGKLFNIIAQNDHRSHYYGNGLFLYDSRRRRI